jgi:hypothetical protein
MLGDDHLSVSNVLAFLNTVGLASSNQGHGFMLF